LQWRVFWTKEHGWINSWTALNAVLLEWLWNYTYSDILATLTAIK
jgi:hypothetical protein